MAGRLRRLTQSQVRNVSAVPLTLRQHLPGRQRHAPISRKCGVGKDPATSVRARLLNIAQALAQDFATRPKGQGALHVSSNPFDAFFLLGVTRPGEWRGVAQPR